MVKQAIRENPELIYHTIRQYVHTEQIKQKILNSFKEELNSRIREVCEPGNPAKGPLNAPITIICYNSFGCATCAEVARMMDEIMVLYPGKIRLVFKNNPLESHATPLAAAEAAMAAHKQGQFWAFRDLLHAAPMLTEKRLSSLAEGLGLNMARFHRERKSEAVTARVRAEQERAEVFGLEPPAVLINGVRMDGRAYPRLYYTTIIDDLLAEGRESGQARK